MISFANPAWLYGLLGLLIPIGIHLLSRKEGKTIYMGSVRHLVDSDTAQFSSIRLNEIMLLILRLLLLTSFVFLLAGFNLNLKNSESKRWLVIERGIENDPDYRGFIDSLITKGFEPHWLTDDLPALKDSIRLAGFSNYYKLVKEIQAKADTAIVLSYNFATQFKGEPVSMASSIKWLDIESEKRRVAVQALTLKRDSVLVRMATSGGEATSYEYLRYSKSAFGKVSKIDSLQQNNVDTITVTIFAAPEFDYDRKIIQASIQAIASGLPQQLKISITTKPSEISQKSDFVFWLSEVPCQIREPVVIAYASCFNRNLPLIISREKGAYICPVMGTTDWIISQRLTEENALEKSLSFSLANVLLKDLPIYDNERIAQEDHRSLPQPAAFMDRGQNIAFTLNDETTARNQPLLFMLLFLTLIIERYLAFKRNQ